MGASKQPKTLKALKKNEHPNAPTDQSCKKTLLQSGQTTEANDSSTLAACFTESKGSQHRGKMEARIEPKGTQTAKKQ